MAGEAARRRPSSGAMVLRYLAAFGPASVMDVQAWSGLTRLRAVVERLRPRLLTFRNERGIELFDLPGAPRPRADAPAPVRFLPEYDNLLLPHADRTRVVADAHRSRIILNGVIVGTVLVDGFVAAMWRIGRERRATALLVVPFRKLAARDRAAVEEEGGRLLGFAAAESPRHTVELATPLG